MKLHHRVQPYKSTKTIILNNSLEFKYYILHSDARVLIYKQRQLTNTRELLKLYNQILGFSNKVSLDEQSEHF